ncbi:MAG: hydrogenase maturation nickel metallochaperone HypA [Candidatus Alcyoniella australis]|nr:hydrogenase maturation nickel metallochaperone HypA [Candidatus Alcyoniella australis]
MHEPGITRGIMDTVLETLERERIESVVRKVNVTIGVCQGLVPDAMQMFFEMERPGTPLAEAELVIELQPMIAHCPTCDKQHQLDLPILFCPECGSQMELIQGKELLVTSIEVDQ